jgi:HEAT repeat protein
MIKGIFFILLTVTFFQVEVRAQKPDQRTLTTKIADLLAELPAQDTKRMNNAMLEIDELGEQGFVTLMSGLSAPGKANNATLEYAIGGYSAYVMQGGKESQRSDAVDAYRAALAKATDKQEKEFIISQLELVGKDDAVSCLKAYLMDGQLADPAARALVKINSATAKSALNDALAKSQGAAKLAVIEALGLSHTKEAVPSLNEIALSADANVTKLTLAALAQIADPRSASVLTAAAQKANYQFDQSNAVASLLRYANNLLQNGNNSLAEKIANQLHSNAKSDNLVHVRTAALNVLSRANNANRMNMLVNAMDDDNSEYRAAALKFAMAEVTDENASLWISKLSNSGTTTKTQIISMLAETNCKAALPAALKLLKSKDQDLRFAAIHASASLGHDAVVPDLYKVMRKGDSSTIAAVTQAMLRMKGNGLSTQLAAYLPKAAPEVQVAILQILSSRAANAQISSAYALLNDKNPEVSTAAFAALQHMVAENDLPQLFTLLKQTEAGQHSLAVQDAVIAVVKGTQDNTAQQETVLNELNSAPQERKSAYYRILASLGGTKALQAVSAAYDAGNAADKKSAILALGSWSNLKSLPVLLKIGKNTNDAEELNSTLSGYLGLVKTSSYTSEQRYLKLNEAMAIAKTIQQKQAVLRELEQAKTFNGAVLAGKFLGDKNLQQAAANTVMTIILADPGYHGTIIKDLLDKTINTLKGGDSEYQKEAMRKYLAEMPKEEGFVSIFNGKDLTGWKGLVADPIKRAKMDVKTLAEAQAKADNEMLTGWKVEDGELRFQIKGENLATVKKYGDFEMLVDWKIIDDKKQKGDAGIYLRGTPQVQIWDNARVNEGAQVGSGGLYNNQIHPSKPIKVADNPLDEWNTFRIIMKGDRVTVYLNGELVTDNVILENYWDRNLPIFAEEQIELQAHGSPVAYRNIYIRELPRTEPFHLSAKEKKEGYKVLFDGTNMHEWIGNTTDYVIEGGDMAIRPVPGKGSGGNLFTKDEYSDFIFRFEFQLTPGANNGLGIRAPLEGDAAYEGMELQILDNDAPIYKDLHIYQYHGSIYGTLPAKRGFLKPTGDWNYEEVVVKGPKIKVILNGTEILDADITAARKNGAADGKPHPGLLRASGHIGFLGHGSPLRFRNIRIKDLSRK